MKNSILLFLIFCSSFILGQNKQLLELTLGTAHSVSELWQAYPKDPIEIMNTQDKTRFTKNAIVMSDAKKSWGTIFAIMLSPNNYYIASYAPLLNGQNFNGSGEFYLYENTNGRVTQLEHYIGSLRPSNNESNLEYLDNPNKTFAVSVIDKLEVQFFLFKGYVFSLPKDYYDYSVK